MRQIAIKRLEAFLIFQSTHPLRDATVMAIRLFRLLQISIHAPLTGCDVFMLGSWKRQEGSISIHAPLTGCDKSAQVNYSVQNNFNPRTPYGMRHKKSKKASDMCRFQSTHPLRDATFEMLGHVKSLEHISIHAPLTGCDTVTKLIYE